jgi:hypothetical protein
MNHIFRSIRKVFFCAASKTVKSADKKSFFSTITFGGGSHFPLKALPVVGRAKALGAKSSIIAIVFLGGLSTANASEPNYVQFFQGNNNTFIAYIDTNNQDTAANGDHIVTIKEASFDADWRNFIKKYWPGAEDAAYSLDGYIVDCSSRKAGENLITYYDQNGFPLVASHDYGGKMHTPQTGSMAYYVIQKICG